MPTIAFLGSGNMAGAIVDGLLAKNAATPAELVCLGGDDDTAAKLKARTGIAVAASLDELLLAADTLVVAFKPQHLATADPRLAVLTAGKLVVSILAGKKIPSLARVFPQARNIVRTMPNTPGQIGAGITAWCARTPLAAQDHAIAQTLLGALGTTVEVPEADLDAVTGLSGSGPAYVFEFAAALRDAGLAAGLTRPTAEKLSVETLLGAARLLARKQIDPEILRDQVTSPNGTTYAGLQRMKAGDFRGLIRETVLAATVRSKELSQDS
ncbi:MAG: pyrroline-5-carboxylate reductase [Opitutaceae bacterium]|nr:pyrroline-5-carboxylate reductase [Opitutaceae bacterium]